MPGVGVTAATNAAAAQILASLRDGVLRAHAQYQATAQMVRLMFVVVACPAGLHFTLNANALAHTEVLYAVTRADTHPHTRTHLYMHVHVHARTMERDGAGSCAMCYRRLDCRRRPNCAAVRHVDSVR